MPFKFKSLTTVCSSQEARIRPRRAIRYPAFQRRALRRNEKDPTQILHWRQEPLLHYRPDTLLEPGRIKPRVGLHGIRQPRHDIERLSSRFEDGFRQRQICADGALHIHLQPAEHDGDKTAFRSEHNSNVEIGVGTVPTLRCLSPRWDQKLRRVWVASAGLSSPSWPGGWGGWRVRAPRPHLRKSS